MQHPGYAIPQEHPAGMPVEELGDALK